MGRTGGPVGCRHATPHHHPPGFRRNSDRYGGSGVDIIEAGGGADTLLGGTGADFLAGGRGSDVVNGGTAPAGVDDSVTHYTSAGPVTVDLAAGTILGEGNDTVANAQAVYGSAFGDILRGSSAFDSPGWHGDDVIMAQAPATR